MLKLQIISGFAEVELLEHHQIVYEENKTGAIMKDD